MTLYNTDNLGGAGGIAFDGKDSGTVRQNFATIKCSIVDRTAGSEDADLTLNLTVAGSAEIERMRVSNADVTITGAHLRLASAASCLKLSQAANGAMNVATLVAGTVTVSNTTVATGDRILVTRVSTGGTVGAALTYTISNGVSFTITSDNLLDTSVVLWVLLKPA